MKKIILRSGKTPFEVFGPSSVKKPNLIANNSGNILFAHSVYKALSVPGVEVDVNRYRTSFLSADEINERYDCFVIPLANSFRKSFVGQLDALSDLIERLKIPCVVVGVGAQTDLDFQLLKGSEIDSNVKRFARAVLDRSSSIGVRGEFTKQYLNKLGFSDVDVIGCPSMFLNGPRLCVEKRVPSLSKDSRIALNLTPKMSEEVCNLFRRGWRQFPNAIYVPQDGRDYEYLYMGKPVEGLRKGDALPGRLNHPLYKSGQIRFFYDVSPWLEEMRSVKFSFGTRIHGNVFALLAGTPALVVAHDSRTLELAQYFEIPHIRSVEVNEKTSVESLYDRADCTNTVKNHAQRFDAFRSFIKKNGLPFIYDNDDHVRAFESRLSDIEFYGAVRPLTSVNRTEISTRVSFIHDHYKKMISKAQARS